LKYKDLSKEELKQIHENLKKDLGNLTSENKNYNLTRGLPSFDMVDFSNDMFEILKKDSDFKTEDGIDCRNYGVLDGIVDAKKLMGELMSVPYQNVIVGGNSSLMLMHFIVTLAYTKGLVYSKAPWSKQKVKILFPCPGYDRHFDMCKSYDFELVAINFKEDGPDIEKIEELIKDDSVKGIFCVPKYSNPTGHIYSDKIIRKLANLSPAAEDFCIFYDNAYAVHDFDTENPRNLLPIWNELEKNKKQNMVIGFSSTSKITIPGSGISALFSGSEQIEHIKKYLALQIISFDKVNQLRHTRFLKDLNGIKNLMKKTTPIAKSKFDLFLNILNKELKDLNIANWSNPKGGYFISFNTLNGLAKRTTEICNKYGINLIAAGSTFPYGNDPQNNNIRIAPTALTIEELEKGAEIFANCVKLVAIEFYLRQLNLE